MIEYDRRAFKNPHDTYGTCRKCGCNLILLPDDRRQGFCFDCYDPYSIDETNIFTCKSFRASCASE